MLGKRFRALTFEYSLIREPRGSGGTLLFSKVSADTGTNPVADHVRHRGGAVVAKDLEQFD